MLTPNSVYLEGLGPAGLYSVNYDRLVIPELAVRIGVSYFSFSATAGSVSASSSLLAVPITASYVGIRSGAHELELGGGATILYASGSANGIGVNASGSGVGVLGTVMAGYRFQPLDGGFQFRVGAAALAGKGANTSDGSFGVQPWGYISFGYTF